MAAKRTKARPKGRPIEPWQIRRIKGLQRQTGVEDADYRMLLQTHFNNAKSCKDLLFTEAEHLIRILEGTPVQPVRPAPPQKVLASSARIRMLRFYAMSCSLHYADMRAWSLEDGSILHGEELREWLKRRFELNRIKDEFRPQSLAIPKELVLHLFENWINAKANAMLVEGGFKRRVMVEHTLYYEQLSTEATEYLINRFRAMHEKLAVRETVIH